MKKQIVLIAALIITCFGYTANAQVHLQINIGSQPIWGPVGYDHASYYYLPDIDAYYDVNAQQYVYLEGGQWVTRPNLPSQYANYDLYGGYKVVVNSPRPWMHAARYRTQYAKYRGRHGQQVIRDSHMDKYRANPNHPEHNQFHGGQSNHGQYGGQSNHGQHGGQPNQAPHGGQPNQNHGQHGGGQPNQAPHGGQPNQAPHGGQPNQNHGQHGGQPGQAPHAGGHDDNQGHDDHGHH